MTDPATAAPAPTDPAEVLAVYRSRREQMVVLPQGNLALVNTQWISHDAAPQPVYGIPGTWAPIEPGVSGATWLGMPPGKENWRNSLRIPSASWLMPG